MQGEIIASFLNPTYWGTLWSTGWGRSKLAAQLYDGMLFNGATFGGLTCAGGGAIARLVTSPLDLLCIRRWSRLSAMTIARLGSRLTGQLDVGTRRVGADCFRTPRVSEKGRDLSSSPIAS